MVFTKRDTAASPSDTTGSIGLARGSRRMMTIGRSKPVSVAISESRIHAIAITNLYDGEDALVRIAFLGRKRICAMHHLSKLKTFLEDDKIHPLVLETVEMSWNAAIQASCHYLESRGLKPDSVEAFRTRLKMEGCRLPTMNP